jgi:hypothetical protein
MQYYMHGLGLVPGREVDQDVARQAQDSASPGCGNAGCERGLSRLTVVESGRRHASAMSSGRAALRFLPPDNALSRQRTANK